MTDYAHHLSCENARLKEQLAEALEEVKYQSSKRLDDDGIAWSLKARKAQKVLEKLRKRAKMHKGKTVGWTDIGMAIDDWMKEEKVVRS